MSSLRVGPPSFGGLGAAAPPSQSLLAVRQHPTARDEAIKNAWLRPDGLSFRRERGCRLGREENRGKREGRKRERVGGKKQLFPPCRLGRKKRERESDRGREKVN